MTKAARVVLGDCRETLQELEEDPTGSKWRRRWASAVVLLRAVGHVLDKVDSDQSDAYRQAIADAWQRMRDSKPKPEIFWGFIEPFRNDLIKEYQLSAGQGVTAYIGGDRPPDFHYPVKERAFKGQDQRDVVRDAIKFWEDYLDRVDADARRRASCSP